MSTVTLPITAPAPAAGAVDSLGAPTVRELARRLRVPALVLLAVVAAAVLAGGPARARC
jgi:hypothetical protein